MLEPFIVVANGAGTAAAALRRCTSLSYALVHASIGGGLVIAFRLDDTFPSLPLLWLLGVRSAVANVGTPCSILLRLAQTRHPFSFGMGQCLWVSCILHSLRRLDRHLLQQSSFSRSHYSRLTLQSNLMNCRRNWAYSPIFKYFCCFPL